MLSIRDSMSERAQRSTTTSREVFDHTLDAGAGEVLELVVLGDLLALRVAHRHVAKHLSEHEKECPLHLQPRFHVLARPTRDHVNPERLNDWTPRRLRI